ncbi:MAG: LapA family protein [Calditrichia bacterium]
MRIALAFVKLVVFVLALIILVSNAGQNVTINLLTQTFQQVNLVTVIVISMTLGGVLGAVFMAFNVLQSNSKIKQLNLKNRQLSQELDNLRNVSIEEIPEETIEEVVAIPEKASPVEKKLP